MTRKMFWLGPVALLGAMTLLAPPAAADDPKPAAEAKQETQAGDVELLAEAYRLRDFARGHKAPEAAVTAGALVLKLNALTKGEMGKLDAKLEVLDEKGNPVKGAKVATETPEGLDKAAEEFFDEATSLGRELGISAAVEAMRKAAKARRYTSDAEKRGAVGGPKWVVRVLPAKQSHVYTIPFDTYTIGSIGFEASAPTRCKSQIGSYVHFNQVVRVGQYTWKPRPDQPVKVYTITVHNHHNFPVTYRLFTN
jgi:hypothetical protein